MKIGKLFLLSLLSLLLGSSLMAQMVSQPLSWSSKIAHIEGNIYEVQAIGIFDVDKTDWHIYDLGPYQDGPNPTALTLTLPAGVKLIGKTYISSKVKKIFDTMFNMEIGICEDKVVVAQKVEVSSGDSTQILATIEWMTCDNSTCLPPTEKDFKLKLPPATGVKKSTTPISQKQETQKQGSHIQGIKSNTPVETTPNATNATNATTTSQQTTSNSAVQGTAIDGVAQGAVSQSSTSGTDSSTTLTANSDNSENANNQNTALAGAEQKKNGSLWAVIIEAIIWGFVALLTPCVFPMVPMTVSFFLKGSENKSKGKLMASLYGFFIVALYTIPIAVIILITYFAGGEAVTADIFNWLATHWVPNVIFFLIFMVFAASFFGAFEIVMPSWLVNKSDSKSDKGGIIGVFFMALTLVLVSFSCTGPIVGTILIKSTQGDIWEPIITMFAFSAAFALPFTIFAFAPSLLKDLPKSGGWLNSVKVVLGFLEVALGFKFLSVADQTYHWGILDREVYLAIWIVVFALLGLYLLGKIRFAHDSKVEHLSVGRLALSIIVFSFVIYLIPGMWGAPLKALSGYMPPITSQDFSLTDRSLGNNSGYSGYADDGSGSADDGSFKAVDGPGKTKYSDFLHLPHGLQGFFEYKEAVEYAKKVNKPLFIDFTGHGCVNCREMESRVWSDPRVLKLLKENYVVLALYADDKKNADEKDWITNENGRVLKSIGKINSQLAMKKFNVNAQPYYALLNPTDESHLAPPRGYNLDIQAFISFLQEGLANFK